MHGRKKNNSEAIKKVQNTNTETNKEIKGN